MTLERYWMTDLADIKAIELKCRKCGAARMFPATDWRANIPIQCENCKGDWIPSLGVSEKSIQQLTKALERLAADEGARGCTIRFRISEPSAS